MKMSKNRNRLKIHLISVMCIAKQYCPKMCLRIEQKIKNGSKMDEKLTTKGQIKEDCPKIVEISFK